MASLPVFLFTLFQITTLVPAQRSTYIVHMDKSFMPKPFTDSTHWYSSIMDSLNQTADHELQYSLRLLYTYDKALHGFSALLTEPEVNMLKRSPGFVSLYRDDVCTLHTTYTPEFLSLDNSDGLWPASQYGKNVIIGVIDTGIWPESPSYNDDGMGGIPARWKGICEEGQEFNISMCNKKLIGVRYFNKGWKAANPNKKWHMNSGRDTFGHGTHTSSTAAGNYVNGASFFGYATGTARGMAPRAHVAMYKVGQDELTDLSVSDVVAGVDQAIGDGVDVISISIAFSETPLYEDPIAIASFAAMENGVFVSCAAGNGGPVERVSNGFPWVLTVTAGSIDRLCAGTLILGNNLSTKGWSTFPGQAIINNAPLLHNQTISLCNSIVALPTGFRPVVICQNSTLSVSDQLDYAAGSNAAAAIIISDEAIEDTDFKFPGVVISSKVAPILIDYVTKSTNPVASIKFHQTFLREKRAPAVATYSSHGPSPSYPGIVKPDVMAPGSLVLASWVPNKVTSYIGQYSTLTSEFNMVSGTSMACPHAAGIAALLKGAHPEWTPAAIRSAMMTTASPFDNTGDYIRDDGLNREIATPLAMGSGQVNPNAALDPGLIYDITQQDYISLLCSMNLTRKQIRTITRSSYNCSNSSSDLNYPSFIAFYANGTTTKHVKRFRRTVTNVGDEAVQIIIMKENKANERKWTKTVDKSKVQGLKCNISKDGGLRMQISKDYLTWLF